MEEFPEDAKFVITPEYYLYMTISEYGIDPDEWMPRIWQHIFLWMDWRSDGQPVKRRSEEWLVVYIKLKMK